MFVTLLLNRWESHTCEFYHFLNQRNFLHSTLERTDLSCVREELTQKEFLKIED